MGLCLSLAVAAPAPAQHTPPVVYATRTLAGDSVRIGAGVGSDSLTLVNVWATWCRTCRAEFRDLDALVREFAPRGLRVLAVSVDEGPEARVRAFAAALGPRFAVAHDSAARVARAFRTVGVPETYLVTRDGRVVWRHGGAITAVMGKVRQAIGGELKGR